MNDKRFESLQQISNLQEAVKTATKNLHYAYSEWQRIEQEFEQTKRIMEQLEKKIARIRFVQLESRKDCELKEKIVAEHKERLDLAKQTASRHDRFVELESRKDCELKEKILDILKERPDLRRDAIE